ncbi:acyl-CoA dehydrogenase family protein [Yinghuangia aomiensis]
MVRGRDPRLGQRPRHRCRGHRPAARRRPRPREVAEVTLRGLEITSSQVLQGITTGRVRRLAAVLAAAEAVGVARWCFETAVDYVKIREQFGRAVGSFQAVKHKASNIFTRLQVATAAAWDGARAADERGADAESQLELAAAEAAVTCLPIAREIALDCITMLGGIEVHVGARHPAVLAPRGVPRAAPRRPRRVERTPRPPRAGEPRGRPGAPLRTRTRRRRRRVPRPDGREPGPGEGPGGARPPAVPRRRVRLRLPHYPKPYGIGADPAQQIVIQQEFARAGLVQPSTITRRSSRSRRSTAHGTDAQKDRFVPATLRAATSSGASCSTSPAPDPTWRR